MPSSDHAAVLAGALPADPDDHDPIGVPSDALRAALSELVALRGDVANLRTDLSIAESMRDPSLVAKVSELNEQAWARAEDGGA
jgi:hypothetical protein